MVTSRALRATACAGCRLSILRGFYSLAGQSIRAPQACVRSSRYTRPNQQLRFSSQLVHESQTTTDGQSEIIKELLEQEEATGKNEVSAEAGVEVQESEVPWYLQSGTPNEAPKQLPQCQRLPNLPTSAPPILQPLMQQISIDLGIDDLSLLDLRKLDPPPAFGANLLMLLGTARSEKHLHVSADRLCRWLRSSYKLRPDAVGLLGRNEMKLKLKRKAKRAKLLGSANDENTDDGVRTGWVCVDVGSVEGCEEEVKTPRHENFVGFGRRTDRVRIVVQMLTEEKREEIDLEGLWSGILKRSGQAELATDGVGIEPSDGLPDKPSSPNTLDRVREGLAVKFGQVQTREMHTFARRMSKVEVPVSFDERQRVNTKATEESLLQDVRSGNYEMATNCLEQIAREGNSLQQDKCKLLVLKELRIRLEGLSREHAVEELGIQDSSEMNAFFVCFNRALSSFPGEFEADTRIWLACFARELGHREYPQSRLFALFEELESYGVKISAASYLRLLKGILRSDDGKGDYYGPSLAAAEMSSAILETMHDQGIEIIDEDILVSLQEVIAPECSGSGPPYSLSADSEETFELPSLTMSPMQYRLHTLIMTVDLPFFRDVSRMRLMDLYARHGHWKQFFEIFRMAPKQGQPQSANVYAFMFRSVAQKCNQKACMAVLRTWIPDLEAEKPAIKLEGDVGKAIEACLIISDPSLEQDALNSPDARGEWLSLWRRIKSSSGRDDPAL
ncbi:hypothetical protein B2J93_9232 [Marssonina coronariae]|uniref:ATPase synthesis protein 25 n=1 Tax=Diplocarpon coronariae TaxID=2795749 RepID=A0A218ZEF9_9HELO|nr:hypothetical protein B2J93_9232 [Marssonina coronariae]